MPPKNRAFSDRPPKYPPEKPYRSGWSRRYAHYTQSVVWHMWTPVDTSNLLQYKLEVSMLALFYGGRAYAAIEIKKARIAMRLALQRCKHLRAGSTFTQ